MLTLALDTATRWGRFAVAADGEVLAAQPHNISASFADSLLTVACEVCERAGCGLAGIRQVAVTRGPGSFTGVRIAVATAKGLAYALAARLVAVPTTEAMAAALLADHPGAEFAVPALDARRGEIYAAIYQRAAGWVRAVVPPAPRHPDAWWRTVRDTVPDVDAAVCGGDGVPLLMGPAGKPRPELQRRGQPVQRLWSAAHPDTASILARAASRCLPALTDIHPFALVPLYLRGSDAEVKRRVDVTPRTPSTEVDIHRAGGVGKDGAT